MKSRAGKIILRILFLLLALGTIAAIGYFAAGLRTKYLAAEQEKEARIRSEAEAAEAAAKEAAEEEAARTEALKQAEEQLLAESSETAELTETPEPTETPELTETPEPASEEEVPEGPVPNGHKVAIDAGHQGHQNTDQEPIGPGASATKAKVSSGTYGPTSGLNEYELNLMVALKLRDELLARGYEVLMIRETHDVDISNSERAKMASEGGADILVRIHANGSDNTSAYGTLNYQPSEGNPYMPKEAITGSRLLSQLMLDSFVEATGAKNLGLLTGDDMSGINWSTIPVTIVEMGFMTNPEEDARMATEDYQDKMAEGMANGIDAYFAAVGEG